ncbi:hypothetical protein ONS95_012526 [Cadophora gregata]|uniref:uncharacterized protein n=1 Tax=Cadophora gregata TaxID=51156 RepID=UPI0026DC948D|nr:uncharacterized protein ONS95_012526 [Cadophora gregata]KAK0118222.1 hypothetical protein ONS95_012526 [Cadophora gregata]KAK0123296.1 hypothetical protein ONS96_010293 [Cadophora gregata f. sp. sojae]
MDSLEANNGHCHVSKEQKRPSAPPTALTSSMSAGNGSSVHLAICTTSISINYTYNNKSTSSLSINADSLLSISELEFPPTETGDTSPQPDFGASQPSTDHLSLSSHEDAALSGPTSSIRATADSQPSKQATPLAAFPATEYSRRLSDLNVNNLNTVTLHSHAQTHTQSQLQLWAFETSRCKQTLAKQLEQGRWEDNTSCTSSAAASSMTVGALATYEIVMDDDWYVSAAL